MLAAGSKAELDRWVTALQRAIRSFRRGASDGEGVALSKEEAQLMGKTPQQLHLSHAHTAALACSSPCACAHSPKASRLLRAALWAHEGAPLAA